MAKARNELKGAEDELAKTHEKVRKLTEKIEKELGDTGKLKTRDKLESGENFVGNGGIGIAFGSAAALLALSDSVAAKNGGTSLLAMVNELGQLKKDLETRTQAHVTAQARVAGLEARVSHLEAKEEDARKALKACEDRVEALLDVKLQIEEDWELCLDELIVKGIVEELLFGTEMALEIAKFLLGAFEEDAAAATDDATTGNSTHDEQKALEAAVNGAVADAIKAAAAILQAEKKVNEARQALGSGAPAQASQLAQEAQEAGLHAHERLQAAGDRLDGAFQVNPSRQ